MPFGIAAAVGDVLGTIGVADLIGTAATGVLADAGAGALVGGGVGGLDGLLTGGSPWKGALHGAEGGALTGGGIGLGGSLLGSTLGATAADALGGAAGGALGGSVTGQGALPGAVQGGLAGGIAGLSSPTPGVTGSPIGGAQSGAPAAPASIGDAGLGPVDINSQLNAMSASGNAPIGGTAGGDTSGAFGTGAPGSAAFGTGSTAVAGATPQTSGQAFLSHPSVSGLKDMLMSNPGAVLSAGGMVTDALKQNQLVKGERQIQQEAGQLAGQGKDLQGYLASGTLPPGVQSSITQAAQSQKAAIRSRYASEGSSGSSAEQQDLAAVDSWAQGQGAQTALGLLQQGVSESGLAAGLYQDIAKNALAQDQALGSAFGNFASSVGGADGKTIKLQLAGQ